ncbi:hypothetical protein KAM622c_52580 (plasmid) [Klebsiella quasipneumoniae subsp. quasipneumoniae]|nr:hypothetical protein KAM622c_52580 [Klebsiella quasipneumoniae subsp. quasipneumoniae]
MTKFTNHIMTNGFLKVKTGGFLEFTFHYIEWVGSGLMYVIVIKWFFVIVIKVKNRSGWKVKNSE